MTRSPIPRGMFGRQHDGLTDPERYSAEQRRTTAPARLGFEITRRRSPSPLLRRLQAATDRALGRAK